MIPKRIVAIGASSCEGKVDVEGGGFVGRLRQWLEAQDQRYHVYNLGISGDTSRGVLERLERECVLRKPGLIICMLGANDGYHLGSPNAAPNLSLDESRANVRGIVEKARLLADVLLVSIYPIDESRTMPVYWDQIFFLEKDIVAYAAMCKELSAEMDVPYVNIFDQWKDADYKKYLHTDGLHANSQGHQFIFEQVKAKLEALYST